MKKFAFWVATHQKICSITTWLLWIAASVLYLHIGISPWIVWPVSCVFLFLFLMIIASAPMAYMKDAVEAFNFHCDPYPLIQSCEELLSRKLSEQAQLNINGTYCNALIEAGEFEKALINLQSVNIENSPSTHHYIKILHYGALYECSNYLGQDEQAENYYQKILSLYAEMKNDSLKKQFTPAYNDYVCSYYLARGNFEEAEKMLSQLSDQTYSVRVSNRLKAAKIHLHNGQTELAAEDLQFVIQNGNKMYFVSEAKALLETL